MILSVSFPSLSFLLFSSQTSSFTGLMKGLDSRLPVKLSGLARNEKFKHRKNIISELIV